MTVGSSPVRSTSLGQNLKIASLLPLHREEEITMSTLNRFVCEIPLHIVVAKGSGHLPAHATPEISVVNAVI